MTSVIRVKRKRVCEPAEALLLARKKLKNEFEKEPTTSDIADIIKIEEKVFHFAGTVEPDIAHSQQVVAERVKEAIHQRNQQKAVLQAGSRKRKLPKFSPFSELPKMKLLKDATIAACQSVLREKCLNFSSDGKPDTNSKKAQKLMDSRIDTCEKCTVYHNDDHIPRIDNMRGDNVDSIMCNNIKMFRERLNVSSKPIAPMSSTSEFVYDLYYCKDTATNWDMSDLLYVQPYRYSAEELLAGSESDEELHDDDDDSNDEDNWRNDYPDDDDEDDSSGSSSTSEDDWERFVQQEEEDMENDDDDLDGGNDDANDGCGQLGGDDQDYDYHDDMDAEAGFDYGQNDDNNDTNDANI